MLIRALWTLDMVVWGSEEAMIFCDESILESKLLAMMAVRPKYSNKFPSTFRV